MDAFLETIMEKHAGWLGNTWGKLPFVRKYRQVAASPGFKVKAAIGTVGVASLPTAYTAHKLSEEPKALRQTPGAMPTSYN